MYSSSFFSALLLALAFMYRSATAAAVAAPHKQAQSSRFSATCSGVWTNVYVDGSVIPQSSLEAQMETAQTVIDAYNAWDVDAILAYRTPDCQHQVLPSSMARAAQNNGEYRAYLSTIMPKFKNFTVAVHQEIHDAEAHTCMIHASSMADTKIGPYANEYTLSLTFTDDGTKVLRFDEFVDSGYSARFMTALKDAESSE